MNEVLKTILAFCLSVMAGFILMGLILTALLGCGYQQSLREACHINDLTCDNLFGRNQQEIDERQDAENAPHPGMDCQYGT